MAKKPTKKNAEKVTKVVPSKVVIRPNEKTNRELLADPKLSAADIATTIIAKEAVETTSPKGEAQVKEGQSKTAEPEKLTLPTLSTNCCIPDKKYWEGKDNVYDPTAKECKDCLEMFPDQPVICAARTAFLISLTGKKKTRGVSAPRVKVDKVPGIPNQTELINTMLREATAKPDMITRLAVAHYGENVKGAESRINRHVTSILDGTCKCAEEMKPFVQYLLTKPVGTSKVVEPA